MEDVLNWLLLLVFTVSEKKNVIIEFLKPGYHLSEKSQTTGDFTAKRQNLGRSAER